MKAYLLSIAHKQYEFLTFEIIVVKVNVSKRKTTKTRFRELEVP